MPVSSTSPIKILLDLGINLDNLSDDEDYLSALMEAANGLTITNPGDERIKILQDEIRRVRADRKKASPSAGMKATKKRIGVASILGKEGIKATTKTVNTTKLLAGSPETKKQEATGGFSLSESLSKISESVTSIAKTLKEQQKQEKKESAFDRKAEENRKRGLAETNLEKGFKKVGAITQKILKPVKSILDRIIQFFMAIIVGKVLIKFLDWIQDPANQQKIKSFTRFLIDHGPKLLVAFLLFGTTLGRMATRLVGIVIAGAIKLGAAITKLAIAHPKAAAIVGLGVVGAGGIAKLRGDNPVNEDEPVQGMSGGGFSNNFFGAGTVPGSGNKDTVPSMLTPGEFVMSKGAVEKYGVDTLEGMNAAGGGTNRPTLMPSNTFGFNKGGQAPSSEGGQALSSVGEWIPAFSGGGMIPGRGPNKDSIPAMLTPGEFVMSRDAVDKYGANTFANMNAAVGGINKSALMGRYNKGGKAFDRSHYGTPGYQIGQIQPPTLVVHWAESKEKIKEVIGKGGAGGPDYDKFIQDIDYSMPGRTRDRVKYKAGSVVGEESFAQDIATIGVPDLLEHKDQLLAAIHAVKGYEKVNIDDVIRSRVNMPLKQYLPILMRSDAQKATFAKEDAAHQRDKQIRGIKEGEGYSMGYDFNLGGLVQGLVGGGLVQKFAGGGKVKEATLDDGKTTIDAETGRTRASDAAQGFMRGVTGVLDWATFGIWDFDKRGNLGGGKHGRSGYGEDIGAQRDAAAQARLKSGAFKGYVSDDGTLDMDALLGKTSPTSVPGPPNKPTTTVAYDQTMMEQAAGGMPQPQMKLPQINASAMISTAKIATLGISV